MFIATSTMVMQWPETSRDSNQQLQYFLDTLQQKIDKSLLKQADQSTKNHDRIISKAEVGHKKMDEVLKKLNSINESVVNKKSFAEAAVNPVNQNLGMTLNGRAVQNVDDSAFQLSSRRDKSKRDEKATQSRTQNTGVLTPNANTDLVVKGLHLDVTGENLVGFLQGKGVNSECSLLTTFNNAKSLAYKITIDANKVNVVSDPALWPESVKVQTFKQRRRNSVSPLKSPSKKVAEDVDNRLARSVLNNHGGLSMRFENSGNRSDYLYNHILRDC